jgi:hypothetical protein
MNKEFIPYEQALELKQLGFDEPCFGYYNTTWSKQNELLFPQYAGELENWNEMTHLCSAPLYSQAFRWFREKHNLEGEVHCIRFNSKRLKGYQYAITSRNYQKFEQLGDYHTYEEAELACITELIEIVKKK